MFWKMIRVVPDTNVLISSIFWKGSPYLVIKEGLLGNCQLILSSEILDEAVEKLRNKFKFPEEKISEFTELLLSHSHLVKTKTEINVARDKDDNKIIECAIDGKADYIVTGDPDLLVLKKYKNIKIATAREFLEELKKAT